MSGVHRPKKPLFTLTGFPFESQDALRSPPFPGHAADCSQATKESLNSVHTYSGHSPDQKSKSNENPCALAGVLIWSVTPMVSKTSEASGHADVDLG